MNQRQEKPSTSKNQNASESLALVATTNDLPVQAVSSTELSLLNRKQHGFTNHEIESFFQIYKNGRVPSTTRLTSFTAIEDFIIDTRRSNGILDDYVDIENIVDHHADDERAGLMHTWLCRVVPSCVFRFRSVDFGQTGFYCCCFADCATPLSSQFALIRHYREQHYSQIPAGIFGRLVTYDCSACRLQFKREQHLKQHCSSLAHITRMAMLGSDTSKRHLAALQQSRHVAERVQVAQQGNRLAVEEELFYAGLIVVDSTKTTPVALPTSSRVMLTMDETTKQTTPLLAITSHDNTNEVVAQDDGDHAVVAERTSAPVSHVSSSSNEEADDFLSQQTKSQLTLSESGSDDVEIVNLQDPCPNTDEIIVERVVSPDAADERPVVSKRKISCSSDDDDSTNNETTLAKRPKLQNHPEPQSNEKDLIKVPQWLMKSRVDAILANNKEDTPIQPRITDHVTTRHNIVSSVTSGNVATSASSIVNSTFSSAKNAPRSVKPKPKESENVQDVCKKCGNIVKWLVCTGQYNRNNLGRIYYKCSNCSWFQWKDQF